MRSKNTVEIKRQLLKFKNLEIMKIQIVVNPFKGLLLIAKDDEVIEMEVSELDEWANETFESGEIMLHYFYENELKISLYEVQPDGVINYEKPLPFDLKIALSDSDFTIKNLKNEGFLWQAIDEALQVLRDAGYYVDNLWHVDDVKNRFDCSNEIAQKILNDAVSNEYFTGEINVTIAEIATDVYNLTDKEAE